MADKSVPQPTFGDSTLPGAVWDQLVVDGNGCWIWRGNKTANGYGLTRNVSGPETKPVYVHRLMYERLVEQIAEGLELDHLCRVPLCANPAHLEPVTHLENILRSPVALAAINARKTHCKRGHPFDRPYEPGKGRSCRVCAREHQRRYQARKPPIRAAYQLEWNRQKRARLREEEAAGRVLTPAEMRCVPAGRGGDRR